jgi:hypothetical protein
MNGIVTNSLFMKKHFLIILFFIYMFPVYSQTGIPHLGTLGGDQRLTDMACPCRVVNAKDSIPQYIMDSSRALITRRAGEDFYKNLKFADASITDWKHWREWQDRKTKKYANPKYLSKRKCKGIAYHVRYTMCLRDTSVIYIGNNFDIDGNLIKGKGKLDVPNVTVYMDSLLPYSRILAILKNNLNEADYKNLDYGQLGSPNKKDYYWWCFYQETTTGKLVKSKEKGWHNTYSISRYFISAKTGQFIREDGILSECYGCNLHQK